MHAEFVHCGSVSTKLIVLNINEKNYLKTTNDTHLHKNKWYIIK